MAELFELLEEFPLFVFRDLKSNFEGLNFSFELAYLRESAIVGQLVVDVDTSKGG